MERTPNVKDKKKSFAFLTLYQILTLKESTGKKANLPWTNLDELSTR